ncbi:hypothetical protein HDZ31DRAFT_80461 [Schizophyllum fasciatum]
MLAALRASAVRCPPRTAGLATASRPLRNANSVDKDLDRLQNAVREEGQKQQEQRSSAASAVTASLTGRPLTPWHGFGGRKFISPRDFTYKERTASHRSANRKRPSPMPPPSYQARARDVFHKLNVDPLQLATHPLILKDFVTEMGMIKGRNITFLTSKSQRRLTRAIKRAKMMGVIPQLSRPSDSVHRERVDPFADLVSGATRPAFRR